jgi:phenylalanyl-tRNA synthetase beta chain
MKVPLSWIREFVDVKASAEEIGTLMGVRGLALEGLEHRPALSEHSESTGDDVVMDFDVTANRPDCLSVVGIAREIAAAYQLPLLSGGGPAEAGPNTNGSKGSRIPVTIEDPDLCGRYVAAGADVTVGPSPAWMQERLTACGVRPISNIVDITNYVMLELGQPMHAFDLAKMRGGVIKARRAKAGETMTTLDGRKRSLSPDMLVIADAECAEDIGGVMGGANSEISSATTRIAFEAAWFKPASIRATSKQLGLKTEASTRFERGMDITAPPRAMARACGLLEQIGAGKRNGPITDVYPVPYQPKTLRLERRRIVGLLGMDVPDAAVTRILASLGFEVSLRSAFAASRSAEAAAQAEGAAAKVDLTAASADPAWDVVAPPWRADIHRQVDLIEEVGRHHGFEHLPTTFPGVEQAPPPSDPRIARDRRVRTALLGMGFSEAITFAFIEAAAAEPWLGRHAPVAIANPLSEKFAVMRPSLLPGLVDAVSHNRRHGRPDVRLFEIGTRFSPDGETRGAGFAWTGLATADHWSGSRRAVDFSDAKGVVEQLVSLFSGTPKGVPHEFNGVPYEFAEVEAPYLVSGRAASVTSGGRTIGVFGQLSPAIAEARELPAADDIYVGELDLDALSAAAPLETLRAKPLPRYPSVVRDLSILVADTLSADTVRGTIRSAAPATLIRVREFDRYQGKGIPDGKVSLSFRLTFQSPERTLTDDEVQAAMESIIDALTRGLQAVQR